MIESACAAATASHTGTMTLHSAWTDSTSSRASRSPSVSPSQELHHHDHRVIDKTEHVVHGDDVRMLDGTGRACFVGEPHAQLGQLRRRAHQLQRDALAMLADGRPHRSHAALAEVAFQTERADHVAGLEAGGHGRSCSLSLL